MLVPLAFGLAILGAATHRTPPEPPGEHIVRQMHDRYVGKWFRTLIFVQATTQWKKDGSEAHSTWYESASVPSVLRIDMGAPAEGNGVLFTADSTFRVEKGAVTNRAAGGNDLLTLLFDVYVEPIDRTLAMVHKAGYDLDKTHRETWQGRPVIVVGADSGNLSAPQFWVDAERLIVLRQVWHTDAGDKRVIDAHLNKYRPIGASWIAPECEFFIDGRRIQREEYTDIKADVPLSPELFDLGHWTTAPHWVKPS
jgi:hypothetical protein